jgi:hypothetical protein
MRHSLRCWSGVIPCLLLAGLAWAAPEQPEPDPQLLAVVNKIKAIDNHCHAEVRSFAKDEEDNPLGRSLPLTARLRETNPEWIETWRTLYGYKHNDASLEHVRELLKIKKALVEKNGKNHPAWVLDQAGIEIALAQMPKLGPDLVRAVGDQGAPFAGRLRGEDAVGSWPKASNWARRRASSWSVLRLVCLNFPASLAVLATLQARPRSPHRSATQPARAQASMPTPAGRSWSKRWRSSWREGVKVSKRAVAVARS